MAKNKAKMGRPSKMTGETIGKLEQAFLMSLSDREACLFANIHPTTLYEFCEKNLDFRERKELLKEQVKIKAKTNIVRAIDSGDRLLSQWWLERKSKDEFSTKSEVENSGTLSINVVSYNDSAQVYPEALPGGDSQGS